MTAYEDFAIEQVRAGNPSSGYIPQRTQKIWMRFRNGVKRTIVSQRCYSRAIGVARDVFIAIFGDDQNVVFAVSPCACLALGNGQHGFHGNDHTWF